MEWRLTLAVISLSVICIAFGIAESIIYSQTLDKPCGLNSTGAAWNDNSPPLFQWILGAAVSDLVIGVFSALTVILLITLDVKVLLTILWIIGITFEMVWTIYGIYSWLGKGLDCVYLNNQIWTMAAARVLTFVGVLPLVYVFVGYYVFDICTTSINNHLNK